MFLLGVFHGDKSAWSQVPNNESVFAGAAENIVTVGGGTNPRFGADSHVSFVTVWTSIDGITWTRVPDDDSVFGNDVGVSAVIVGGPALVAVGNAGDGAAVWIWQE